MSDPALTTIQQFIDEQSIDKGSRHWRQDLTRPPRASFDPSKLYVWTVETNKGTMEFRLLPEVAPMHVSSTLYLTLLGFYDNISFHRVIDGFMAQGGCPRGDGTGGPGYEYGGECSREVRHDRRGLLSMANAGPDTDGSQFFITFVPTPHLDGKHTIFGELIAGDDTLRALEAKGSRSGRTSEDLVMVSCTVRVEDAS